MLENLNLVIIDELIFHNLATQSMKSCYLNTCGRILLHCCMIKIISMCHLIG